MKPTSEQIAIIEEGRTGRGHILIDALAGCAKTTTLIETIKVMPQRSILFAAFNKGIADEAAARCPRTPGQAVVVQTLHALGRSIVMKHFPMLEVDKDATEILVNDAIAAHYVGAPFEVRRAAVRLVRCAKETLSPGAGEIYDAQNQRKWVGWPAQILLTLGFDQGLFSAKLSSLQIDRAIGIASAAIVAGVDVSRRTSIDFCDMVWLPQVLHLAPPSRYQAILLDEVQDVSAPQLELLERLALPQTRWIVAGDEWQQLYSWRGSLGSGVWQYFIDKGAQRLPLTITWRCSHAVVKVANELVPELRAQPQAEEGTVTACTLGELPFRIAQGLSSDLHTFVLSRSNAPLLDCALFLWRAGVKFQLNAGQAILEPLYHLLDRELDLKDATGFCKSLLAWHRREADKAAKAGATSRRDQIDEQRAMLLAAARYAPPSQLRRLLAGLLADNKSGVKLSTVHKVKGLEAERVFLLRQTFARQGLGQLREADPGFGDADELVQHRGATPTQEELNIEYVAITRAKEHLCWVDLASRDRPELLTLAIDKIAHEDLNAAFCMAERAAALANNDATSDEMAERLSAILARLEPSRARLGVN